MAGGVLSYQQSMEVAAFMDKVQEVDFPDPWREGGDEELRQFMGEMKGVFRACLPDNEVLIS